MWLSLIGLAAIACGVAAIRATRLAIGALWLAGLSACAAGIFYLLGARELAVIELSVGIGLVTVLLVYGIAMAGENARPPEPIVPQRYASMLAVLVWVLAATVALPVAVASWTEPGEALAVALWSRRGLDVLAQAALVCIGALGVLAVLAADRPDGSGEARQ